MALKLTGMDWAPPAPPPPRVGVNTRESQRRVRDLMSNRRLPSRQQLQQHRRELEEAARRESLRLQAAQHYQGGADGGDDGPWDATTSELRNQQFDLVDAFVENPTKVFTTAEVECMPWWLRIIHDPDFKKSVTTSITAEIRHFEEHEAQRDPQILVTTPGAWNPKSSLNRVPGDGLTYRWLVSFPVTGFVHLPFITSRALDQPGCAGVHVFAAADAKNYAATKDAQPFATYPLPRSSSVSEKPRGIAAVVHSTVASPPQETLGDAAAAASPGAGLSPASPAPPSAFPPPEQQAPVLTAATTAQLSARKAAAEAKALRKKKRLARRREAEAAAQLSEVYQARPGTSFPPRLWDFKTTDQERAERLLERRQQRRGSRTLGQYRDGASTSDSDSCDGDGADVTISNSNGIKEKSTGNHDKNNNSSKNATINLFRNVHDDAEKSRIPPIEYIGTLRASHRLLRFRFLSRALYNVCKGTARAPYGRFLTAGIPHIADVLEFKSYDRTDLTDSRIEFLFSSDSCRAVLKTIFSELPKDINGRATKPGMVQLVLDLVGLFMPSFYTQSNIELAEDEWVCRGTCERPDFYQFCWFFFDFPMIVMRSEFLSEDLYAAFWTMVHHQIFVLRRNNSDGYEDHVLRQQLLQSAEVQQLSPSRRAHHVQRRLDLMHAAKRREEHRRQLEEQYDSATGATDPSGINASFGGTGGGSALLEMVASPAKNDDSDASPKKCDSAHGNEYLDRRRAGLDILSEWRKHRVGEQQSSGALEQEGNDGQVEQRGEQLQLQQQAQLRDSDGHAIPSSIAAVNAEIDEVRAALDAHDAENADLGNDRDDVDSLLSYCSDVSEREFESDNFRVRDKYQRRKAQERDADRVTIRRRLKILTLAKKRMEEEEQERLERRAEEARRQEEAQLASFIDVAAISGGGGNGKDPTAASIARSRNLFASIRAAINTASLSGDAAIKKRMSATAPPPPMGEADDLAEADSEDGRHHPLHLHHRGKQQPVPPAVAARAREERRRRVARLDSRGGPRKQYSMFCAPSQHIPAPPPAPPATTAELAAQVDGMSPWAAKVIANPGMATKNKQLQQQEACGAGDPPKPKRIQDQPVAPKPKAPEPHHPQHQQQQQFRASRNDLASPTFAPSEPRPVQTARRPSAPKISRLSDFTGSAASATNAARPSAHHHRRASPPGKANPGSSTGKPAPRRPTAAFGTASRGNPAGLDPTTAPVKEQKMSRSMLNPSRALQALFPLHPRTVLMGQPAGEVRPDTR